MRGSPKKAPIRLATIWNGRSLGEPSAFQLLFGTMRKRWWESGETCAFQTSFRSWLLVVVPPRSTSAMIPRPGPRRKKKSGSCLGDESCLRSQHDLLSEPELGSEQHREVILKRLASRTVDMEGSDLIASRLNVVDQPDSEAIDGVDLFQMLRRDGGLDVPPVALHELELRSCSA